METKNSASAYAAATQILLACRHQDRKPNLVLMRDGTRREVCRACWSAHMLILKGGAR